MEGALATLLFTAVAFQAGLVVVGALYHLSERRLQ
jgi:hypothetical protein